MRDCTVRQIVHVSIGGPELRVHFSNAFGATPLHITSAHIARPVSAASEKVDVATDKALSFAGKTDVTIPPGAEFVSDALDYAVAPLSNLAVTIHIEDPPEPETGHPGSRATTYFVHGDFVAAEQLPNPKTVEHWYVLSGIDVTAPQGAAAIVVLGDSITDGHATTTNGNDRWTDVLAERLQGSPATKMLGVLNQGIGGNHLLTDSLGPNALARFDRDVVAQAGVKYLIVLEGVNDLGGLARQGSATPEQHAALVERIISSYQQIVYRAHAHGIRVLGATILPYAGSGYYHPAPSDEADRQAVNQWIRGPGHFDAVVDFDKKMLDPSQPDRMLPAYDSGDHLHPGPGGYRVMGDAVDLGLFKR